MKQNTYPLVNFFASMQTIRVFPSAEKILILNIKTLDVIELNTWISKISDLFHFLNFNRNNLLFISFSLKFLFSQQTDLKNKCSREIFCNKFYLIQVQKETLFSKACLLFCWWQGQIAVTAWALIFSINHYPVRFLAVYMGICVCLCVHVLACDCLCVPNEMSSLSTLSPWGARPLIVTIVEESVI